MRNDLILMIGLAAGLGLGGAALAEPDLTVSFGATSGTVRVKNIGDTDAGQAVVVIQCAGLNGASCPDPAPADVAPYLDAAYPNMVVVDIPALAPGKQHNHVISFFGDLDFEPGKYSFAVCALAAGSWDESNFKNNCLKVQKTVRRKVGGPGGLTSNSPTN
jgi:hypothetical protein